MGPRVTRVSTPRLLLIDGHSMAFRAFFGLPVENFTTSTGQATNAVHGFVRMLLSLLAQEKPTHVAVAFDAGSKTFRTEEYPEYKGTREKTPEEFKGQVELIEEVLDAFGIMHLKKDGVEADDILATLARQGREAGALVYVVSGDRDTFQLVTDEVTVLYPIKGVSELRRMTPQEVEARYGVAPNRYRHLAALVGEASDNLPGVPGVGPKTAAQWVAQYDGLDGILAHAHEIKGKRGEALRAAIPDVQRNRRLNRLLTDVELPVAVADLVPIGAEAARVHAVCDALEFRQLRDLALRQLPHRGGQGADVAAGPPAGEAGGGQAADGQGAESSLSGAAGANGEGPNGGLAAVNGRSTPRLLRAATATAGEVAEQLEAWREASTVLGASVEGVGSPSPFKADCTGLALSDAVVSIYWDLVVVTPEQDAQLREFLRTAPVVTHDAKAATHALSSRGMALGNIVDDVALAAYLCFPDGRRFDLAELSERYLDQALEVGDGLLDIEGGTTALAEAAASVELHRVLGSEVDKRGATGLLADMELPVASVLARMERAGIGADAALLAERRLTLDAEVEAAANAAFEAIGKQVNLSSPKQLQEVLFTDLGLPKTRRTKTGYTTDAEALRDLAEKTAHPFLAALLLHRDRIKLRQNVEGLAKAVEDDGRIRTTFQQTAAATGRLSSLEPNLQNIPARTEEGRRVRQAFVVGEGYDYLLTADYSQIEMRIMAHLSGDAGLIEAFNSGEDLHSFVAGRVYHVDPAQVTPEQRSKIKAMSYGLAYGLSPYGLSKQLRIDVGEAKALMDDYFSRFGAVRDYLAAVVRQATLDGYTQTILGRRRYLPDLASDNRQRREMAERAALNAPIQGSAADLIKVAMLGVQRSLDERGLKSRLLLQVHDELVLEVGPGEAEEVEALVRHEMAAAASLSVPLDVSVGLGRNWLEAGH
ncbi:DNA polymerase I [Buchananella felis]|uniref:DNA polymerase I n=1 Tax=Buchananella felis TaxID=3231492 RepID=UPI003B588139